MLKKIGFPILIAGLSEAVFASGGGDGSAKIGEVFNFGMLHLEWPTALFLFVVFITTTIVLNTLLFKPILRTLESRRSEIDKNIDQSLNLSQAIENSEQDYQAKLAAVRDRIQQSRQQAIDEALSKANELIGNRKESIAKKLETAEKELAKELTESMKDAASLIEELSQLIKTKVLA
ncbi:ATP synthase F0 subunit B [bacterium]|nr:ATP synthase F0 subunit B [bacterium]